MPLADYADNASPKPPFGLQEAPLSNILVTGAAGLLGGEICALLVAGGHRVTALVHTNRDIRANDGAPVPVAEIVAGDVSLERFGWDAAQFDAIAAAHELLIHCAATVRFGLDETDYRAVNVEGTRHALALARAGGMAYLHIGTAYVLSLIHI